MAVRDVAEAHYVQQVAVARRAADRAATLWSRVDRSRIAASWAGVLHQVIAAVVGGQLLAADSADSYISEALAEQNLPDDPDGEIDPDAFAGIASDGRDLQGLLFEPAVTALTQIGRGSTVDRAMTAGAVQLDMIVRTQVADAGRVADGVAIAARKAVGGYVRALSLPSCSRCIILAGRFYAFNDGFLRHPRCDCRHIPSSEDAAGDLTTDAALAFESMTEAEQDKAFTKAGAEAIRDGADMARVVNARRGMYTASGRLFTTESAGRRQRLMPEQVYAEAGDDRAEVIRLLRLHGYLRGRPAARPD